MTTPLWLSPLSHDVPWSGRERLPHAPPLWVRVHRGDFGETLGVYAEDEPASQTAHNSWRAAGWVLVERPRVESGRTA